MGNIRILLKHGTDAEVNAYTGTAGELVVKDNTADVRIIDGVTPGGKPFDGVTYSAGTVSLGSPINGATNVAVQPALVGSSFNGDGTLAASYWQIARDAGFTDLVHDSGRIAGASVTYNPGVTLDYLTTYYARVKYESSTGVQTDWSTAVSFTTKELTVDGTLIQTITAPSSYGGSIFGLDGMAMSRDGQVIAAKQRVSFGYGNIQTYTWIGTQYAPIGDIQDINDERLGDELVLSNDGTLLATATSNQVRLYSRSGTTWTFVGGYTLTTPYAYARLYISPDSSSLYVTAPNDNGNLFRFSVTATSFNLSLLETITPPTNYKFRGDIQISADGSRMVAGLQRIGDPAQAHIALFTKSGSSWGTPTIIDTTATVSTGYSPRIKISDDGSVLFIGYGSQGSTTNDTHIVMKWNGTTYSTVVHLHPLNLPTVSEFVGATSDGKKMFIRYEDATGSSVVAAYTFDASNDTLTQTLTIPLGPTTGGNYRVEVNAAGTRLLTGYSSNSVRVYA